MTFPHKPAGRGLWLVRLLSVAALLAVWHIAAHALHAPLILPAPLAVARRLASLAQTADFWRHVAATSARTVKSTVLVVCLGSVAGVLCGMRPRCAAFMAFPLAIIRSTPVVSFILLALFWLGSDAVPVFCAVLMAFPLMVTAVATGCARRDETLLAMARVFRLTRGQVMRYITAAELLPFFAAGARASFGMAWKVVAASEVLSLPRHALGTLMQTAQVHLETADVLAVSLVLVLLSLLCECAARQAVRLSRVLRRKRVATPLAPVEPTSVLTEPCEVSVRGLSVAYGGQAVLDDFSLTVEKGELLALLAPSGAGKTTLLDHIAARAGRVSYAFQEPRLLDGCTLLKNVALPLERLFPRGQSLARAAYFLRLVGLGDRLNAYPPELSGGERQRVALARALAFPADVLLLDEAFRSQDAHGKNALIALLTAHLRQEPKTVVFVTHDLHEAAALATRVIVCAARPLRVTFDSRPGSVPAEAELSAIIAGSGGSL
ncbi:MAG: ATP-binding cassette domain-containing protein [Treponema sp.]|nr:ATP-binding cassette domain-containing protein [Treponema sp.]